MIASSVDRMLRQLLLISIAMAMGVVIFSGVVVVITGGGTEPADGAWTLRLTAGSLGLLALVLAQKVGAAVQGPPARGAAPNEVVQRFQNGTLAAQGVREAVGLAGGVLGFVTGDLTLMGGLAAAAVVALWLGRPTRNVLEMRLRMSARSDPRISR